jgi:2-methylcitrate dehydratase PrpD
LDLVTVTPLDPEQVEKVELVSFHQAVRLYAGIPSNTEQAQYAITFPVAAALVRRKVGVLEISDADFADPDLAAAVDKFELIEDAEYSAAFPATRLAHIRVIMKDGTVHETPTTRAKGDPDIQFTDAEIIEKFHSLAGAVVDRDRLKKVEAAVAGLDETSASLDRLAALVFSR